VGIRNARLVGPICLVAVRALLASMSSIRFYAKNN
jgi:hypothetical protein